MYDGLQKRHEEDMFMFCTLTSVVYDKLEESLPHIDVDYGDMDPMTTNFNFVVSFCDWLEVEF